MSDLTDLHGIFPTSLRWNAEIGVLAISIFNGESGERELKEIELGRPATFVLDMLTRERGYGQIRVGFYDMRLTPVGSPPPPWPGDAEEYKPAVGCWCWSPEFGELRLETNGTIFRQAVASVWDAYGIASSAAQGQQPVISFTDRVPVPIKSLGKSFQGPVIKIVGWIERNKVPGWGARAPTVALPAALPILPASSAPAPLAPPELPRKGKVTITSGRQKPGEAMEELKRRRPDLAEDLDPSAPDPDDPIPF